MAKIEDTNTVVVTRHPALITYLVQTGIVEEGVEVVSHADEAAVRGKHVIGVLPLRLAALAASITEVPLVLPPDLRGVELTIDQIREHAGEPSTYVVRLGEIGCKYCGGNCPNEPESEHLCDGFAGDIDHLYDGEEE